MKCPNCNSFLRVGLAYPKYLWCWKCKEAIPNPDFKRASTPGFDKLPIGEKWKKHTMRKMKASGLMGPNTKVKVHD